MALVRDRCICLRKTEYSETSQILALFGREHGLVRVIAKGAHRRTKAGASKFDGGIDFLDVGEAVFTDSETRDLNTLTEWHLTEGNQHLHRQLRGMWLGLYAGEMLSLLIEERDPHPNLFDQFESALAQLGGPRNEETFLVLQLDILRETGHLPELFNCVECGRALSGSEPTFFSPDRGGVICRECEAHIHDRMSLDGRLLRLLQMILRLPRNNGVIQRVPKLTRHQTDPINLMFRRHIQHQIQRELRVGRYVVE